MTKFEVGDLVQWKTGTMLFTVMDSFCAWCRLRSLFGAEFDVPETELKFVEPSREESDCPISDEQYERELVRLARIRRSFRAQNDKWCEEAILTEQKNREAQLKALRDEAVREPR